MSASDEGDVDKDEEGFFEFDNEGGGACHFGYAHGHTDCMLTTREGESATEWTWDDNDEMDPVQG